MKTTQKTTTSKSPFVQVLKAYEAQAATPTSEREYTNTLTTLAQAVAYSVLKKCINVSQNETLVQARRDIARDTRTLANLAHASNGETVLQYNENGDLTAQVVDKELHSALLKLSAQTLGDGLDLVHEAVAAILAETQKAKQTPEGLAAGFMEREYTVRRLNRKVWIKNEDSANGWETVTTTPIQEIYKAVRRSIEQSRAVQADPRNGYTYIADISTDTESGECDTVYRRFNKYADIGGTVRDFNGKETAYTADMQTVIDIDAIIERMNLTDRQAKVLSLRQSGYGYKAIATYLGITQRAVAKTVQAIQVKAAGVGLTPDK